MNKNIRIKKPSIANIVFGVIVSRVRDSYFPKKLSLPQAVGKYKLISEVKKLATNPYKNFALGIYADGKKKVFIKTWQGGIKDYNYYSLLNEYVVNKTLSEKIMRADIKQNKLKFRIPKVYEIIFQKGSFSVVFEYVEGKMLATYPKKFQAEVLTSGLTLLKRTSYLLSETERNALPKRTRRFYLFSLFSIVMTLLVSRPKDSKVLLKAFISSIKSGIKIKDSNLFLAHRDLALGNFLINSKNIYMIDCERIVLTLKSYDHAFLAIMYGLDSVRELIFKSKNNSKNMFLETYIALHFACNATGFEEYRNYYLNIIKEKYE